MFLLFRSSYNREYRVVVQPYFHRSYHSRRFLISPNSLYKYIGSYNANTALLKASNLRRDKLRLKFRSFGIVDIYLK